MRGLSPIPNTKAFRDCFNSVQKCLRKAGSDKDHDGVVQNGGSANPHPSFLMALWIATQQSSTNIASTTVISAECVSKALRASKIMSSLCVYFWFARRVYTQCFRFP